MRSRSSGCSPNAGARSGCSLDQLSGGRVHGGCTGAGFDPIPLTRLILDQLGGVFETDGRYDTNKVTFYVRDRKLFTFAKYLGLKSITCEPDANAFDKIEALVKGRDLFLGRK